MPRISRCFLIGLSLLALHAVTPDLYAQSFRDRVLGTPLSKRPSPGASSSENQSTTGSLTGSERFLRENRQGAAFIGTTPGVAGFIGAIQSQGAAAPVTNNLNANRAQIAPTLLNPPRSPARKNGPYEVRLQPGFQSAGAQANLSSSSLQELIRQIDRGDRFARTQATLSDRTVVLTGTVTDSHDRELLESFLRLEPGVEEVRNDLVVAPPPAPTSSP